MEPSIKTKRTVLGIASRFFLLLCLSIIVPAYADDVDVPDADGDCIPDSVEKALGSNPLLMDSDGDFISDTTEFLGAIQHGPPSSRECPLTITEAADTDEDGTPDIIDADSDNDEIPDFMEAGDRDLSTNPIDIDGDGTANYRDQDSDNDGLSDTHEVEFLTDPWVADTDGGGIDDGEEVFRYFSNPNDPSDDQAGWIREGERLAGGGCGISHTSPGFGVIFLVLGMLLALLMLRKHTSSNLLCPKRQRRPLGRGLRLILMIGCALSLFSYDANAAPPDGNIASIEGSQIRPSFDASGFYGLRSANLNANGEISLQGWLTFLSNTLSVETESAHVRDLISKRIEADLSVSLGLFDNFETGIQSYVVLTQEAYYPGMNLGQTASSGFGDVTVYGKYAFPTSTTEDYQLAIATSATLPTGNENAYMGQDGMGWRNDFIASQSWGSLEGTLNVGWSLRPRSELFTLVDHHKLHFGGGIQNRFNPILSLGTEVHAAAPAGFRDGSMNSFAAEMWFFLRIGDSTQDTIMGGGSGMTDGYGTPGFRSYVGMNRHFNTPTPPLAAPIKAEPKPEPKKKKEAPQPPPAPENELEEEIPPPPENLEEEIPPPPAELEEEIPPPPAPEVVPEVVDNDEDGLPNDVDKCPDQKEDPDGWEDDDGCPDPDNDADDILDFEDTCPNDPEDKDKHQDQDGCPDPDNDNDGILDAADKCPNRAENINGVDDLDGCPESTGTYAVYEKRKKRIRLLKPIEFGYMKVRPGPEAKLILDDVAAIMRDHPEIRKVAIQTHTDKSGGGRVNMWISRARGRTIRRYLVRTGGISGRRLVIDAYGETRNKSRSRRSKRDRRVEFQIIR